MRIAVSILALGAVLAASGAQAQVVSRSISEEPVETIVTQTPNGTIVTRRPLGTDVTVPYAAPVMARGGIIESEADSVDAVTTRQVVRRVETRSAPQIRSTTRTTKRTIVRPAERVVERPVVRERRHIVLSPAERQVVYQTIVQREVVPAPRVAVQSTYPAPVYAAPTYRDPVYSAPAYRDPAWRAPVVAATDNDDDEVFTTRPVYATPRPVYTVGRTMPAGVPLYAVPQEVAVRVPAAQPYSYAYVGGRVYLVDPSTSIIVADVTN